MKKHYIMLTILLCFCYLFYGCSNLTANETPSPSISPTPPIDPSPTPSTNPAVTIHPVYGELPVYQPGSILLEPQDSSDGFEFKRKYRLAYYLLDYDYMRVAINDQDEMYEWIQSIDEKTNYGEFRNEMLLVTFIKEFDIPRDALEREVEGITKIRMDMNECKEGEKTHELCEIPNLDIIYTFDNEIISEYYRYE
jgi:hypothetical protein